MGILFAVKLLYFIFLLSGVKLCASSFHPSWRAGGRPSFLMDTRGERKGEIMQSNGEKDERLGRERENDFLLLHPLGSYLFLS